MSCGCGCRGLGEVPDLKMPFPMPPAIALPANDVVCENGVCCAKQSVHEDNVSGAYYGGLIVGGVAGIVVGGLAIRFLSNRGR